MVPYVRISWCVLIQCYFAVPDVTTSTWQSLVMESDLPVLVEFSASWCGPCKMIDPIVVKLSKEYEGKLKCYKVDTDDSPDIATKYGVRSVPTMMVFKDGEKKDAVIGAVPESALVTCIQKFI
jgi:thioredoxin 1